MKTLIIIPDSFPSTHRALLNLFQEVRKLPLPSAISLVRIRLQEIRNQLTGCESAASITSYERYLVFYAKVLGDSDLHAELALASARKIENELSNDPSRYDQLLLLARLYLTNGQRAKSRRLLQKIASSKFIEAKTAQVLLASLIGEVLK